MSTLINIKQQKKLNICSDEDLFSIEIGRSVIDNGLLKQFPGSTLPIFLYLITHLENDNYVNTNTTIISSYLPDSFELKEIEEGLKLLQKLELIEISPHREGDYTYQIKVELQNLRINTNYQDETISNEASFRRDVLTSSKPSQEELIKALVSFAPPSEKNRQLVQAEVKGWTDNFNPKMLKELIRRVDKWIEKNNNPPEKAFHYMEGIVDDWYSKEIFSYQRLQHFDRLYRETKELASTYGFKAWQDVKPIHMETFHSWLEEDFSLSLSLVKLAIKEAFKRKKDGQPSLKYIEDNFIKPWKQAKIKSVNEARTLLKQGSTTPKRKVKKKSKLDNWNELNWDIEGFTGKGG